MVGFLRFMALVLGLAGGLVYLGILIAVRTWGELVLTFVIWGRPVGRIVRAMDGAGHYGVLGSPSDLSQTCRRAST
jgi:hypothetical protein